jgi:adenylate kinase family enzyme
MKTLVLFAGLSGAGKSYIARRLDKKLKHGFYFDSDLFAKESMQKQKISFETMKAKEIKEVRIESQNSKIRLIRKLFDKFDVIFLDTCFDILEARKLYFNLSKTINIIVLEVKCLEKVVKKRILGNKHESRQPGSSKQIRWEHYLKQKKKWVPVKWKKHFIINSEKDVGKQVNKFIEEYSAFLMVQ